jgi:hypothetical protein
VEIAVVFTISAVLGGIMVLGAIGLLASWFPLRLTCALAAALLAARAGVWHLRRARRFAGDRNSVQAHRTRAGSGWPGTAYFGWILGVSIYTQMATPLVLALAALAGVLGAPFSIAAGTGLGLARSLAPWRGALTRGRSSPGAIVERYVVRLTSGPAFRWLGAAAALILLFADLRWLTTR